MKTEQQNGVLHLEKQNFTTYLDDEKALNEVSESSVTNKLMNRPHERQFTDQRGAQKSKA